MKNDWNTSVRVAAATSIGQIGGPEAEAVLGRAVVYEKKDAVRDVAAQALHVARAKAAALAASAPTETVIESRVEPPPRTASRSTTPRPPVPAPPTPRPEAWRPKSRESAPTELEAIPLEAPSLDDEPTTDRVPPPPPAPVRG
ncbi:MAG: hypothetical protein BGO49_28005 [Planctomycetales bacterium 71-10]|nr:MAG: hypothetical protein BGO49_28005 [Planctomycetales bacterium 71-10]